MGISPNQIDMAQDAPPDDDPYADGHHDGIEPEHSLRPSPIAWETIWETTAEGEDWLVEPFIGRGRLVSLYSAPGVGKSLLALEIAAALACGGTALGKNFTRKARVLYVDHENDPRGDVVERLRDMGYSPRHLENLTYYSFPPMHTLDTERGGKELLALALLHDAELVVIDTVSRTIEGEENENGTWLNLYRHTCRQLKAAEIACLRLDHAGKDLTKGLRGGSAKTAAVDMVWLLAKQSADVLTLTCEKSRQNLPDDEKVLTIRRCSEPLRHELAAHPRRAARQARILSLMEHLNALAVPLAAGRPAAGEALKDAAIKFTNSDLSEALKQRRELSEQSLGQLPLSTLPEVLGQETDRSSR